MCYFDIEKEKIPKALAVAIGAIVVYRSVVMRLWARRDPIELPIRRFAVPLVVGLGLGILFVAGSFAIALALGAYRVSGLAPFGLVDALTVLALVVVSAVVEELIFRGVLLQSIERWIGWPAALVITSLLFGAVHLANPGATWFGALAIAIEAGFFLGAAFLWRRSLWITIGIHAGWNGAEALLGIPVSGATPRGILTTVETGPDLLSGGAFGIEASIIPVVIGAILGAILLVARRRTAARAA